MSVQISDFGRTSDGIPVQVATLKNEEIEVQVITLGAILHKVIVPDRNGNPVDVVLGFDNPVYYELGHGSVGAVVGRFAGRIKGAQFTLDGKTYHLTPSEKGNCLHAGLHGCHHKVFRLDSVLEEENAVIMSHLTPDGVDGFPGNFNLQVKYSIVGRAVVIDYYATTDAPTVCNVTNHSYFNLNGHNTGTILGHLLSIDANYFLESDNNTVPTGRKIAVAGTPMDFTEERTVGRYFYVDFPQLRLGNGYDHCYVINGEGMRHAAWLTGSDTGIRMETLTTCPGVQLYSANFLNPMVNGKDGAYYQHNDGLCFEAQQFPNAPNVPAFPDTTLRPGKPYTAKTMYRFDTVE